MGSNVARQDTTAGESRMTMAGASAEASVGFIERVNLLLCPRERSDGSCHERGDSSGGIQKRLLPPGPPWMLYSPSSTSTWS